MKHYILLALLTLISFPCFCQEVITVDVLEIKEENDSLVIKYDTKIDASMIEAGLGVRVSPVVQAGDSMLLLPDVTVLGKNKEKVITRFLNNTRKSYSINNNESFTYNIRVPYCLWMDSARLSIYQEVSGYRGNKVITHFLLKDRVELEPHAPYQVAPQVSFLVPEKEEKRRSRQGKAYLDFPVGRSVILPTYRRNPEELMKIDDAVRDVVNSADATLLGLYIEGFASPDGAYATNERLSRERATALKDYIKSKFSLSEDLFKVSFVAEDWEGLEALVKASDLPGKDKILETISSIGIHDGREAALMRLDKGVPYRQMLKEMFPELRRVEYQIDYSVKDYDVTQTKELLERNPSDLSQLEFYNLALSYGKGTKEFAHILMEIIPHHFSNESVANNNAAAVMIENGELATAARYLEKAGENASTLNNTGVIYLMEGELEKAEEYFDRAIKEGNAEAQQNKEEVQSKRDDNKKLERYKNRK
ncbi:MAG: hypothetical protein ACK5KT_16705 [Dysgonomonas sp.]